MKDLYTFALTQIKRKVFKIAFIYNTDSMENIKVKHTKKKFKIGNVVFSADAFHPLKFEKGIYTVSIYQEGEPRIDIYHYFTQVEAKNGSDAIEKAKKELAEVIIESKKKLSKK